MIFKTRDGTKAFIKVEASNAKHVEPYTIDPSNMNFTIFDREEGHFDPSGHMEETSPRVYAILEHDVIILNLIQAENKEVPPNQH